MKLKRVINIFGGPGTGKSVLALQLTAKMKILGYSVEIIPEYAKTMVFENRMNVLEKDQFYVAAKQHRQILRLVDVVDFIVTDSPFVQGIVYLNNGAYNKNLFSAFIMETFNSYENVNFLLTRSNRFQYEQMGRYQSEYEARVVDKKIESFIDDYDIPFHELEAGNQENIINILTKIAHL